MLNIAHLSKMESKSELLDIKQASQWASQHLKKNVTPSNISYLIQYGRIKKIGNNGNIFIDKRDLLDYYKTFLGRRHWFFPNFFC